MVVVGKFFCFLHILSAKGDGKLDINNFPWLDLIDYPAFCVKDGAIIATNALAEQRQLQVGMGIGEIVTEQQDIYETFESGNLYLNINVCGIPCPASVVRTRECDIFHLRRTEDDASLQALALAASQLRIPLANLMTVTDQMFSGMETNAQTSQINQNLYRLLRIVSNMSDAEEYSHSGKAGMQTADLTALMAEIMEKAQSFFTSTDIALDYNGPVVSVFSVVNPEKIERAIYNLLSNAAKFSKAGSTVSAALIAKENRLIFTLCNTNATDLPKQNFWQQYRRAPGLEDPSRGLGLGMTLASAVAAFHGGSILVDNPAADQTRITMTIPIVKENADNLRSTIVRMGDYAGGRDKGLIEFSEVLPTEIYQNIN